MSALRRRFQALLAERAKALGMRSLSRSDRHAAGHSGGAFAAAAGTMVLVSFAVLLVCCDLEISAAALAESVEIPRIATAKRILATILVALQSPDRERLLMGLPDFLIKATAGPELGVQFERVLKTGESSIRQLAKFVSNKP